MGWLIAGSLIPSFLVALAAAFVIRRFAARWRLVDEPGHRKIHQTPVPLGGGVAIWLGVVLPLAAGQLALFWLHGRGSGNTDDSIWASLWRFAGPHLAGLQAQSTRLWTLLAAGTVLMLLGLADDIRGLNWRLRIAVQFVVAIAMVSAGWQMSLFVDLPWLTGTISVFWIVTLINTFNMLDNMDGLSGGVAVIAASILAAVMLLSPESIADGPQLFVGGFLLVLVGSTGGFLVHNRPPAKLFMGDAGSYFVGFCMATATISATFAGENLPRHAVLAPLCVLAIPLYDTVTVIAIRLRQGRSPFEGDKSHISHRLVELGCSKRQAVLAIYLATLSCGVGALALHRVDIWGALLVGTIVLLWLATGACLEITARRRRRATPVSASKEDHSTDE